MKNIMKSYKLSKPRFSTTLASKLPKVAFWLVLAVVLFAAAGLAVRTVAASDELYNLEQKEVNLMQTKLDLTRKLAEYSSLDEAAKKAESMGFVKAANTVYAGDVASFAYEFTR